MERVSDMLDGIHEDFISFTTERCTTDENFKFWHKFIHVDCFAYIALYIAIRSGNWDLRNYSIKKMAPLFHVVGSKYYYKLLPYHLADIQTFPKSVIENFSQGGFVMNIAGNNWSSIALDETHEMTVNKDVKEVMSVGSMGGIANRMHYMPYRASMIHNIGSQLVTYKFQQQSDDYGKLFEDTEKNIQSLYVRIKDQNLP